MHVSQSTIERILRKDLKLFPYKVMKAQELSDTDKDGRMKFVCWAKEKLECDPDFFQSVWFSDEAHFELDSTPNKQNSRVWGDSRPGVVKELPLHSKRVTAWCAMSAHGIIGPFWIEDANRSPVTVTKERYLRCLERFWQELSGLQGTHLEDFWFQQDGAAPHTSKISLEWLAEHFGEKIISRKTSIPWPARSPDLTPLDFFLWGYLKARVYEKSPENITQLKKAITQEVRRISPETCARVTDEVKRCLLICVRAKCGHVKNVL